MNPIVTILSDKLILEFTLKSNVSIANAIRRTILSEIPLVGVVTMPYSKNKCQIIKNTSRFTNEMIKHRISCIPIHIIPESINLEDYEIICKKKNDKNEIIFVTTEDFIIINKITKKPLNSETKVFPPDPVTNQYIDLIRLKPKYSENSKGEELEFRCDMSIVTAKENSCFNAASKVTYKNTPDILKANDAWNEQAKNITTKDIEYAKKDWMLLDGKRYFIEDSFDFKIETIGQYSNLELVKLACTIIVNKFKQLYDQLEKSNVEINESESTIKNCFDIKLINESYTIGKVLEYILYSLHFENDKTVSYIAFKKFHPHDDSAILRIGFKESTDLNKLNQYLSNAIEQSKLIFTKINQQI